jgi:hypothetical protein
MAMCNASETVRAYYVTVAIRVTVTVSQKLTPSVTSVNRRNIRTKVRSTTAQPGLTSGTYACFSQLINRCTNGPHN